MNGGILDDLGFIIVDKLIAEGGTYTRKARAQASVSATPRLLIQPTPLAFREEVSTCIIY